MNIPQALSSLALTILRFIAKTLGLILWLLFRLLELITSTARKKLERLLK